MLPHAGSICHKVSLMLGAETRAPGPSPEIAQSQGTIGSAGISITTERPYLVQRGRYFERQLFPVAVHSSIRFSFSLIPKTETQMR